MVAKVPTNRSSVARQLLPFSASFILAFNSFSSLRNNGPSVAQMMRGARPRSDSHSRRTRFVHPGNEGASSCDASRCPLQDTWRVPGAPRASDAESQRNIRLVCLSSEFESRRSPQAPTASDTYIRYMSGIGYEIRCRLPPSKIGFHRRDWHDNRLSRTRGWSVRGSDVAG